MYEYWSRTGLLGVTPGKCDACGHASGRLFVTGSGDRICVRGDECVARLIENGAAPWVP